jgi:ribonuclease R
VRLVDLPNDYYRFDEVRMRLTGRKTGSGFALGDQVKVTVAHVDIRRRHVNLILAEEESEPEAESSEPDKPAAKKKDLGEKGDKATGAKGAKPKRRRGGRGGKAKGEK